MNKTTHLAKNKLIEFCAKNYLLFGKRIKDIFPLKPYFSNEPIPTNRQIREWQVWGKIKNKIKEGGLEVGEDLGIWTPSFCKGIRDSGIFYRIRKGSFHLNCNYNDFLLDIKNLKLPHRLSKIYKNNTINLSSCPFMEYGVFSDKYNHNEYLAGLFTGCRLKRINNEDWMVVPCRSEERHKKVINILDNYKILYRVEKLSILISPFYGALFFGYMPINSASRVINVEKAVDGSKLALVYWNMVRVIGQPVAPPRAQILPYALSYASYWNRGIIKNNDIREIGVSMGIVGISDELRELMKEWIRYNS